MATRTRVMVFLPDKGRSVGVTIHTQDEDGDWPQTEVQRIRPGQMHELYVGPTQRVVLFDLPERHVEVPQE